MGKLFKNQMEILEQKNNKKQNSFIVLNSVQNRDDKGRRELNDKSINLIKKKRLEKYE